jgi:hypothetical protein
LDVQPNTSDVPKAAVESAGSESEFVSCTDEVSLKAFLERIRQERGTEPLELFTVCFGERGVDLNVHIKGELVLSLLYGLHFLLYFLPQSLLLRGRIEG